MIHALIFDCFGVLYQGSLAHLQDLTPAEKRRDLQDIRLAFDRGMVELQDYEATVAEIVGQDIPAVREIVRSRHIRNEPLFALLRTLKPHYKLGMLSNVGFGTLETLIPPAEQAELFDVVVKSSDVGTVKPYPEIYTYTLDKMQLPAEQCLMIDDLPENIAGAEAVGMPGIVYTSLEQLTAALRERGINA